MTSLPWLRWPRLFAAAALPSAFSASPAEEKVFPLTPPATATPAETLDSFLTYSQEAYSLIQARKGKEAEALFERAKACLDLTELPPRSQKGQGVQRALMLKEELLLKIMDLVAETGTDFAFPSLVHYQAEDSGLPGSKKD